MKYFVSFVIVARPAAYDGFVLKLELPCRLRVSVVSYCGLLAFDARDAWPQTGGSLIESGEDGLWEHYCKPCFVNAKPSIRYGMGSFYHSRRRLLFRSRT